MLSAMLLWATLSLGSGQGTKCPGVRGARAADDMTLVRRDWLLAKEA
jgi:hypothetical protein